MLLFKLEPGALDTILYRNGLYLIPRRDGHVLVGSTLEDAGFDKSTDAATRQRLHAEAPNCCPHWRDRAGAALGRAAPRLARQHPAHRPPSRFRQRVRQHRTLPLRGDDGARLGELLADLIEGKPPFLDAAPYRWQAALERSWTDAL
jgi:glycine oxidase